MTPRFQKSVGYISRGAKIFLIIFDKNNKKTRYFFNNVVNKIEKVNIFANCNGVFSYINFLALSNGDNATLLKLFEKIERLFSQGQMLSPRQL